VEEIPVFPRVPNKKMELIGIEPTTCTLRTYRSPN
jgi:hypothetical protein